jgi:hypothetical protein
LARVHDLGVDAGRPQLGQHLVEAGELVGRVRVAGLVGHRQVGADALQVQLGQLADGPGQADQVLGPGPHPVHAGVDLEVDRDRRQPRPVHGLGHAATISGL